MGIFPNRGENQKYLEAPPSNALMANQPLDWPSPSGSFKWDYRLRELDGSVRFFLGSKEQYIYIAVYISYLGFTGLGKQIRIQIVILHGDEWTVHRNDWKHQNLTQEKLSKFERTRWTHHVLFSILDSRSDQQLLFIKYCFRFRGNFFGWSWTCFSSHRNHSWC